MFSVFGQAGLPVEPSAGMGPQQPEARTTVGLRSSFFLLQIRVPPPSGKFTDGAIAE